MFSGDIRLIATSVARIIREYGMWNQRKSARRITCKATCKAGFSSSYPPIDDDERQASQLNADVATSPTTLAEISSLIMRLMCVD
ncbi:hypothetical protein AC233_07780 [Burkholderia sp. HB1]|nr:hypothetical protein AC233_07780 [Burkholderia sp. HB1]